MSFRQLLKKSDTVTGLVRDARKIARRLPLFILRLGSGPRFMQRYLTSHEIKKLQIGSGPNYHEGWLCTDIVPVPPHTVYLDATRRFPFDDATFDCIYSEHMIEHISWKDGLSMLHECRRVMKPGGTIRIATPDLEVLLSLHSGKNDPICEKYIKWVTDQQLEGIHAYKASFVINNAFRSWGHQFLYDSDLLAMAMREAGFINIQRFSPGQSEHEHLSGLEPYRHNSGNTASEMSAFETMILEGIRPN
jgi:predicted SAM-dependent methyltransferase